MANILLIISILILFFFALYITEDFLSPSSIVCESFMLAYICALYSSKVGNWIFLLHYKTVFIFITGLTFFVVFSVKIKCNDLKSKKKLELRTDTSISPIYVIDKRLKCILIIQIFILLLYIIYFLKSSVQFSGQGWYYMIRMIRFTSSYGEGLAIPIPSWILHLTKLSKASAYICLYLLAHNFAVRNIKRIKMPKGSVTQLIIIFLFVPFSIMQAARFEIMVLIIVAIILWYSFYSNYSKKINRRKKNIRKAISSIVIVVLLSMITMSLLSTVVGRVAENNILLSGTNYFGRSMQAFDEILTNGINLSENYIRGEETFYNIVKLLKQVGFINYAELPKHYLLFTNQNGYSLGNTYTAMRRFYVDFGLLGVMLLPAFQSIFFHFLYYKTKSIKNGGIDFSLLIYATMVYALFFYSYEDFFYSTQISFNYLILFIIMFIISKYITGSVTIKVKYKL